MITRLAHYYHSFKKKYITIRDNEEKNKIYFAVISTFIIVKLIESIFANWGTLESYLF